MLKHFFQLFQSSPSQVAQQRLFQARRDLVNHTCQAQYHSAMAATSRGVIDAIEAMLEPPVTAGGAGAAGAEQKQLQLGDVIRGGVPPSLADYINRVQIEEGIRK